MNIWEKYLYKLLNVGHKELHTVCSFCLLLEYLNWEGLDGWTNNSMHGENKYDIFKTFSRRKSVFEI
jgi:hypothetical protein